MLESLTIHVDDSLDDSMVFICSTPADLEQLATGDRKMPKAIGSAGEKGAASWYLHLHFSFHLVYTILSHLSSCLRWYICSHHLVPTGYLRLEGLQLLGTWQRFFSSYYVHLIVVSTLFTLLTAGLTHQQSQRGDRKTSCIGIQLSTWSPRREFQSAH